MDVLGPHGEGATHYKQAVAQKMGTFEKKKIYIVL